MEKISRTAAAMAQEKDVHWVGPMYPFHPKQFVFHPKDVASYIYHFYNHIVRFYTGKLVFVIAVDNKRIYKRDHMLFVSEALRQIKDGDVLIINPNPKNYNTIDLPKKILPLFVQQCRVIEFNLLPGKEDRRTFVSKTIRGSLQTGIKDDQLQMGGSGLPDGTYEIYAEGRAGDEPHWIATRSVKNGTLPFMLTPNRPVTSYFLLTYSLPVSFSQ